MTPEIMHRVDASRGRMLTALHGLHTERDPECLTWEHWTIPAQEHQRMDVEGCRQHDILISSR
jgi:hypothetical protein